jgi:hypothetical protein
MAARIAPMVCPVRSAVASMPPAAPSARVAQRRASNGYLAPEKSRIPRRTGPSAAQSQLQWGSRQDRPKGPVQRKGRPSPWRPATRPTLCLRGARRWAPQSRPPVATASSIDPFLPGSGESRLRKRRAARRTPTSGRQTMRSMLQYRWYRVGGLDYLLKRSNIDTFATKSPRHPG